ncbi:MAG: ATP-binding cassette domain-containing protein [Planctomycetota bacterium]|nr:ATP-binding cassette domain-containing protein [Planctomycetota bacterium]
MLHIQGLVKIHPGPVAALRSIDLELGEGLFGLLGPNGAGKSTFMQVVAGLIEPTAGKVLLDGHDIVQDPRYMHQRLGYLPQDFGFHPDLTGLAMLELLLKLKGITGPAGLRNLAKALLERVNLAHAASRKVAGYSGGMRQRLGLAQAIAGDPRVLIVDEPTAGLDPEERHRFYRLLAEMGSKRIVILSTHIVEDIATLCPRLAVIRGGEVVADTTPKTAREAIAGSIFEGMVNPVDMTAFASTWRVLSSVLAEGTTNRVRISLPAGDPPTGFTLVQPGLEDAYLVLMRTPTREVPPALRGKGMPVAGGVA